MKNFFDLEKMNKAWTIFGLIFFIGIIVRFIGLGEIPVGFHRDEAFLGFNSYSLLKTGNDINGNLLPLHLESFIYSPAGYSYVSIPFIRIFDLSPFSVRFASAFFGSLTILITFLLTRLLFERYIYKNLLAVISSLTLVLSPWHINLSRTATENTLVVFLISLSTVFFLYWIKKNNPKFILLSYFFFGLTFLIYQAPRVFLPLFIPLFYISFLKRVADRKKIINQIFLYAVIILAPLLIILSSPELSLRIRTLNIFNHPQAQLIIDESLREDGMSETSIFVSRIFHNKLVNYSSLFLDNYFEHFSFDFLFTDSGFPDRYRVPSNGLLHLIELPLILLGAWFLLRNHRRAGIFLIGWVLIAPIGSALTFDDVPNLQRSMLIFPAISIISAFGFINLYLILKKSRYSKLLIFLLLVISIYNILFYFHQYYVHQLVHRPWYRQEGYEELVSKTNEVLPDYEKAIITNRESAPTIFFLFFSEYDPLKFQKETEGKFSSGSDSISFYKYEFSEEECPIRDELDKKTGEIISTGKKGILYINHGACKIPTMNVEKLEEIKRKDGTTVFYILKSI